MKNRHSLRGAFTLVELLVVIAIIGLLIGMLLPAINAAREAGRRMLCQSHLKQIGIAVNQHHDANGFYPEGRSSTNQLGVSWAYRLLPYVEEREAYFSHVPDQPVWADENAKAMRTPVPIYFCPSRRGAAADRNFDNNDDVPLLLASAAGGDYAANAGSHYMYRETENVRGDRAGPIYTFSRITSKQVTDGQSHTFAVGERHIPRPLDDVIDDMIHYFQGDTAFHASDSPWTVLADTRRGLASGKQDLSRTKFGSEHPGVTHFVFLDGHVEPITNDTPRNVLHALSTIGDGLNPEALADTDDEDPDDT